MADLNIFNSYSQKENRATNNCGLMLKTLYNISPYYLQDFFCNLDFNIEVGFNFLQQEKAKKSIPDLKMKQSACNIWLEVKNYDWFSEDQIVKHIEGLMENSGEKILILLSNFENNNYEEKFHNIKNKYKEIDLKILSFEDFFEYLNKFRGKSSLFDEYLDDFYTYLNSENYLPNWKYLLDVVPITTTEEELDKGFYICPNTGGAYSHRKAKFFGTYRYKKIDTIYEVLARVVVKKGYEENEIFIIGGKDNKRSEYENKAVSIIKSIESRILELESLEEGLQVFILNLKTKKENLNFQKISPNGLQGKKYFFEIARNYKNKFAQIKSINGIEELYEKLKDRNWDDFYNGYAKDYSKL